MKPADREGANADFLTGAFVSIPHQLLTSYADLGLSADEFVLLLQILAAAQVQRREFLSPQELGRLCGLTANEVSEKIGGLVTRGFLSIGERLEDDGTHSNYFDLKPLWTRLRGRDPLQSTAREWRKDPVTLFEEEFGRPLSGIECEQIRQWIERDGHPEWLIIEALREAVLANKFSFKYIDRILYEWQRHRVRTRQELELYRQHYRDRMKAREETAAAPAKSLRRNPRAGTGEPPARDERYAAFYELFPDA